MFHQHLTHCYMVDVHITINMNFTLRLLYFTCTIHFYFFRHNMTCHYNNDYS